MDKLKKSAITGLLVIFVAIMTTSCVSVAGYQKVYLNDEAMELRAKKIEYFENNIHSYREGAAGGNGGKTGGGCGCN